MNFDCKYTLNGNLLSIILSVVTLCVLLAACAAGDSTFDTVNPNVTDPIGSKNLLKSISVDGSIIDPENRFLSFSKNVERISIIDPNQARETWFKSVISFDFAVALPSFLGVALLAENRVAIKQADASLEFNISNKYAHAAAAKDTAAYSIASIDGKSFEVIRSLGNGLWQHETFDVPWQPIDPSITKPPANQPVLLLTQYNADGTMLTAVSPADGRYAVYNAASTSEPLLAPTTGCAGDGNGTPQNATYRSITWDEPRQVFFIGDQSGNIFSVSPTEPCSTSINNISLAMQTDSQIIHIAVYDNNELGIMQDISATESQISLVQYEFDNSINSDKFTDTGKTITLNCDRPFSSMSTYDLSTRRIIVMCKQTPSTTDININPSEELLAEAKPYRYNIYDFQTGALINSISIDPDNTSGVGVDRRTNILYRMDAGAFGNLEAINLLTGTTTKTVGLFISELLD